MRIVGRIVPIDEASLSYWRPIGGHGANSPEQSLTTLIDPALRSGKVISDKSGAHSGVGGRGEIFNEAGKDSGARMLGSERAARKDRNVEATIEETRKLSVGLFRGDDLLRIIEIDDPRVAFCREFNAYIGNGDRAYPVSLATSTASPSRFSE